MVERSAKFEEIEIPVGDAASGRQSVSGLLGIPVWWPTGARIAVVLAHAEKSNKNHPLLEFLQRELTDRKVLTLRFNFPYAEGRRRRKTNPMETLVRTYRNAIAVLGRDPILAPAQVFVGGHGLGARVAAQIATRQPRIDGAFFLGFPLHEPGAPDTASAEELYRISSPSLFIQGTRDPRCDLQALGRTVRRMGAPIDVRSIRDVDDNFSLVGDDPRKPEAIQAEVLHRLVRWTEKHQNTL